VFSDKIFIIAILVSVAIHGAILFQPGFFPSLLDKGKEEIAVSYLRIPPEKKEPQKDVKYAPLPKSSSKMTVPKVSPPPFIDRESIFQQNKESLLPKQTKPVFVTLDIIAVRKKIVLPALDVQKIRNPFYMNYYQIVREKIKHCAYNNYSQVEVGEVYLTFAISADGSLKEVRLIEEKSSSSTYLRGISLKSIQDASPFPPFPKDLDYPQLSFNVVISFEIE